MNALLASTVGQHILADLYGVEVALLRNAPALEQLLREAALSAGAQVLGAHFHSFGSGDGITGVVLLAESHISVHTWPESGFAALDIFMCGAADTDAALQLLLRALAPARQNIRKAARGGSHCLS